MGWRRRKVKKTDRNVKHFLTDGEFSRRVDELMNSRHRLLAPFPLDPTQVYQSLWTKEQWKALEVLKSCDVLRFHNRFEVISKTHRIGMHVPKEVPVSYKAYNFNSLPVEMQNTLNAWIPVWLAYQDDAGRLKLKMRAVAEVCQTFGQLFRIWPDIESFFTEEAKNKINEAKVKSAYPRDALEPGDEEGSWVVKPEFRPSAFEDYSAMIAEALLLPQIEGDHVATVTVIA